MTGFVPEEVFSILLLHTSNGNRAITPQLYNALEYSLSSPPLPYLNQKSHLPTDHASKQDPYTKANHDCSYNTILETSL